MIGGRRLGLALAVMGLLGALGASPASAAPVTRWVDDDGTRGARGCDGVRHAATTIQAAVNAASPGDTIKVCPGVYDPVTVATASLRLVSVRPGKAVIRPKPLETARPAGLPFLVSITAGHVTFRGFKLSAAQTAVCLRIGGVYVDRGLGVTVEGNRILGRSDALSLSCGLNTGIFYGDGSGLIAHNLVRNFNQLGIYVDDVGPVTIRGNAVRWGHVAQTCAVVCLRPAGGASVVGISVSSLRAKVVGNTIVRETGAGVPAPQALSVSTARVSISANQVTGWTNGIFGYQLRGSIAENVFRSGGGTGIRLGSNTGSAEYTIRDNRVRGYATAGIDLSESVGNTIRDNDVAGNPGVDCIDETVPTQDTWTGNLGDDQNQPHLCKRP